MQSAQSEATEVCVRLKPTSLQNVITLAQKKDAELHIIAGLHNHYSKHAINHISNKQYQSQNGNP